MKCSFAIRIIQNGDSERTIDTTTTAYALMQGKVSRFRGSYKKNYSMPQKEEYKRQQSQTIGSSTSLTKWFTNLDLWLEQKGSSPFRICQKKKKDMAATEGKAKGDAKDDPRGKKPKPSAGLVPDVIGDTKEEKRIAL